MWSARREERGRRRFGRAAQTPAAGAGRDQHRGPHRRRVDGRAGGRSVYEEAVRRLLTKHRPGDGAALQGAEEVHRRKRMPRSGHPAS